MKKAKLAVFSMLCGVSSLAAAQCAATALNVTQLQRLFRDGTMCANLGAEQWQEYHGPGPAMSGRLIDYKKGPGDPVDPSKDVGSWQIVDGTPAQVVYNYGPGQVYSYTVHTSGGGIFTFCGARTIEATRRNGQVSCGF